MENVNTLEATSIEELETYCEKYKNYDSLKKTTWKIDRVSTFYQFQLDKYLESLNQFLKCRLELPSKKTDTFVQARSNVFKSSRGTTLPTIGFFISSSASKKITKIILVDLRNGTFDGTNFDFILSNGHLPTIQLTFQWFIQTFDCSISTLPLPSFVIYKLIVLWTENSANEEQDNKGKKRVKLDKCNSKSIDRLEESKVPSKPLELIYSFQSLLSTGGDIDNTEEDDDDTDLSTVSLQIPPDSIMSIVNSVNEKKKQTQNAKEKNENLFFSAIQDHFQHFFKFSLSACSLVHVSHDFASLGVDSKLKMFSDPFQVLKDISMFIQHSYT